MLISAEKISKSYRETPLLSEVSFYLNEGDKIGIVGINGTGKTTFLNILAGLEKPDSGTIVKPGNVRVAYLPQNPDFGDSSRTVLEQVFAGNPTPPVEQKEYEAKSILNQLGITEFDRTVNTLSGGQKKRVAIAGALMTPCEVFILDEPTNHIDSGMVAWLEAYLQKYKGALVMITHDRYFLDRVTNRIAEIDRGSLYTYDGNYSRFLELKTLREESDLGSERKRQSILKTELAWVQRGVRARGTKSRSRLDRYEELKSKDAPDQAQTLDLSSLSSRLGRKILEAEQISKAYDENVLIRDFSRTLTADTRIGIIGPNGCGKSTLVKMLVGELTPDSGTITVGETVRFGYFSQESEELDDNLRVIDSVRNVAEYIETKDGKMSASQLLEKFLFSPDLQWNTIARLSGGERRRLALLHILIGAPNVLLLDEPTNDLDIQTLMILEEYLETFQGAVLVVSHDRYFLDKVADSILVFEGDGVVKEYLGGYSEYVEEYGLPTVATEKNKPDKPKEKSKEKRNTAPKLKLSFNEKYEYAHIDEEIEVLEQSLQQLDQEMEQQSANFELLSELLAKKEETEQALEEKTERWIYLNELVERIEQENAQA